MKNVFLTIIVIGLFIFAGWGVYNFYNVYQEDDSSSINKKVTENKNLNEAVEDDSDIVDAITEESIDDEALPDEETEDDVDEEIDKVEESSDGEEADLLDPEVEVDEAADAVSTSSDIIDLITPENEMSVTSPIEINGRAKTPDDMVQVWITDVSGNPIIKVPANVRYLSGDGWGDFKAKIEYEFSSTKEGYLEIFSGDEEGKAKDGLVRVKIYFD